MAQEPVVVGPPRRRWPRRILIALNVLVAFSLVATAGAYGYIKFRLGQVPRLSIAGLRNDGDDNPDQPMNVLLVGSDSRKNISKAEAKAFGSERQVGGERSDTIIVLHVDPKAEKASLLSIPRDLYVPIAGTNRSGRINSAFEGGPSRLISTVKSALGIEIDHYVQVDFNGFRGIVDAIGGVKVYFPAPARDRQTGLNVARAGCVELNGDRALQYVRSREYQYYESGRWRLDGSADIGRIDRQQDFIRRVMHKAVRVGRNPATLNALIANGVKTVKMDTAFSSKDILRLARKFRSLEPDKVEMIDIPTVGTRINGASVLRMKQPDADEALARFRGQLPSEEEKATTPASLPRILPSTVRVRVLNGSGAGGQAGEVSAALRNADFQVGPSGDADRFTYRTSVIRYGSGQANKARLLQAYVVGGAQLTEDPTIRGVDLVLVTGGSFGGIKPPPGRAAATTTTTAPPAPSTTATTAKPTVTTQPKSKGAPAQAQC
ncbi:MAG TPA: LCP family protein [Acidimicrobiales bacterium]|nr:LCP family protein [Acidimicrobiales bacterium]